jgi:phosphotransferase system enzyme I (PtsI)
VVPSGRRPAEESTSADAALMDPTRILGFAAAMGGVEGHTAIMARALHLPAVLGVRGLLDAAAGSTMVVVDGVEGRIVFDPGLDTLAAYRRRRAAWPASAAARSLSCRCPPSPTTGSALNANIDLPAGRRGAPMGPASLRTEIQFMNREDLPDEDA